MASSHDSSNALARLQRLRLLCLLEALTLLTLLLIAVPLKHVYGMPEAARWMGPIHGFAFLLLCWQVAQAAASQDIGTQTAWRLVGAAFIPLGGLVSWGKLRSALESARVAANNGDRS